MKFWLVITVVLIFAINGFCADGTEGTRSDQGWEHLRVDVPKWFVDGKFGIYTHWGPYSVPAHITEWYPHGMYMKEGFRNKDFYGWHTEHWGSPKEFGYKDFIPMMTGDKFDADEWAELFEKTGAKFAGPTAEHHDGFAMWDSDLTIWDAKDMGPKVDVTGKLAKAIKKRGMKFVTSFHHARNWYYYPHMKGYDTGDPKYAYVSSIYGPIHEEGASPSKEYLVDWEARIVEVIDKYDPDLLWFDGGWGRECFDPYKKDFMKYYYDKAIKEGEEVGVTYKGNDLPFNVGILDYERGRSHGITERTWLTDTSVYVNSWGYIEDIKYYTSDYLVDELIDIISKNGVMLLNVGPKPDGSIPAQAKKVLLGMGKWLKLNGEAVYVTRPWKKSGEGPTEIEGGARVRREGDYVAGDIRFTTKGDELYAILLEWPGEEITIESLGTDAKLLDGRIKEVTMLGARGKLEFERKANGLVVSLPEKRPCDIAYVLKITKK
jgi:alpha-L-fucosidase